MTPSGAAGERPAPPKPPPPSRFPTADGWSVTLASAPVASPLVAGGRVLLALRAGAIAARQLSDGAELWTVPLTVGQPMDVDDGKVFAVVEDTLHALDAADGRTLWTRPVGAPLAPVVARGGWVLVASGESMTALRAADGTQVWTRQVGAVSERAAIEGRTVYLPLTAGGLLALDLSSGEPQWQAVLGPSPTPPLVYGDRIYVGSDAKFFVCLKARTGEEDWSMWVGGRIIGRASADEAHVYFAAMDNQLRALSRANGNQRWKFALAYRPTDGPEVVAGQVAVPGITIVLPGIDAVSGKASGKLTFPEKLAIGPTFVATGTGAADVAVVSVAGGQTTQWTLSAAVPAAAPKPAAAGVER